MVLQLKGTPSKDNLVELKQEALGISLLLDDIQIAFLWDSGLYEYYGKSNVIKHTDRWDK